MKKNNKLPLYITLIALDFVVTVFLLVIAIIMLAKSANLSGAEREALKPHDMISFFQKYPMVYGFTCVVPLILLLFVNIIVLVIYVRRTTKREAVKVTDLSEEEKEALRQELLKDLQEKKE